MRNHHVTETPDEGLDRAGPNDPGPGDAGPNDLGSTTVLRASDVTVERERSRRRRTVRLLAFVIAVAIALDGAMALLLFRIVVLPGIHVPRQDVAYIPGGILVLVLFLVIAAPLLMAGRSPHILYRPEELDVRLSDVVGADAVVEEVVKTLNLFLSHRTFAERMGGKPRRGLLFEGPPGTGKTYIAKAMAAEAGVPFLFVSSSAFQSMYCGQTNRKIRSFFKALRKYA